MRSTTAGRRLRSWLARLEDPTAGVVAYLPLVLMLVVMLAMSSWQMAWATSDVTRYECYALTFWFGGKAAALAPQIDCTFLPPQIVSLPPFHALPIEYPPLTLLLFSPPLLAPATYYPLLFAALMALTALLIYHLLLRHGPRGAALAFAIYLFLGEWGLALLRFDLVPTALTLLAVLAAERGRWTAAYIALAGAVLLKIYPLLLLPLLFMAEQRAAGRQLEQTDEAPAGIWRPAHLLRSIRAWRWRNLILFGALLLIVTGFFALLNVQGAVASQLSYFVERPLQIESTPTLVIWLGRLFGQPVQVVYTYGSINVLSPPDAAVSTAATVALIGGYLVVLWQSWRGRMDFAQGTLAALLVFIATGKVFSPQYLIWLIPLLAYLTGLSARQFPFFALIALLTSTIYPFLYTRVQNATLVWQVPGFLPIVGLRNLLFALFTLGYLFNLGGLRERLARRPGRAAWGDQSSDDISAAWPADRLAQERSTGSGS
jgi:hypothetical protein